jgi:HD superfamily phosphohydrolase
MDNESIKRKIINDPVYGFISTTSNLVFEIIEHPWFQRLRRIKQLGLTHYVYPSAVHTRFQHALGCMHLMTQTIDVLKSKGHIITDKEKEGALIAILLHDIGHGPFSHTLEQSIVKGLSHEDLSLLIIHEMNIEFDNKLSLAIDIFTDQYPKRFLHQLVSSQLDMDRLDYLSRDSFFTGVAEGTISTHRIIKMLTVSNDELVVESKGIYSIENFIISRRLMYWQVYFHKTVMAAEYMLINILNRAKYLSGNGSPLFSTPSLDKFLKNHLTRKDFEENKQWIVEFMKLDDFDVFASIKVWMNHDDMILSSLCTNLINRHLYKVVVQNDPFLPSFVDTIRKELRNNPGVSEDEIKYFLVEDIVTNSAYSLNDDKIKIMFKDNSLMDISEASDQLNISVLSSAVSKHVLCYPKNLNI